MRSVFRLRAVPGVLLFAALPASAGEQLARLSVEVTVEGYKSWKRGSEFADSKISEKYRLVTHVQSSGEPSDVNPKDPQFVQQQLATAAQVQQRLRASNARTGQPVPPVAATREEHLAQQKKLTEDLQSAHLACKGDINCLMKVSQAYALQSAMTTYPPTDLSAGGANEADEEEEEEAEEAPREAVYLNYYGYQGCPGEIQIVVNNTSEGATADVSGMVPFRQADTADYRGSELNLTMQCLASTLVYDLKARKIYTDGIGHPIPRGRYQHWDRLHGETTREDVDVHTSAEAWAWVAQNLRIADASGRAVTTLPIAGTGPGVTGTAGDGSTTTGEINVTLNWNFQPP